MNGLDTVDEGDAFDHFGQQLIALQTAPGSGGCHDELEHHQPGGCLREGALGPDRAVTDSGEHALDGIGRPDVIPMLGWEVEKGEQPVTILHQALDRLVVFRAVFLGKDVDRLLGGRPIGRRPGG